MRQDALRRSPGSAARGGAAWFARLKLRCIDEEDGESMGFGTFVRNYDRKCRPVVLRGLAKSTLRGGDRAWDLEGLSSKFADRRVTVMIAGAKLGYTHAGMGFDDYVRYMDTHRDPDPLYLFEHDLPEDLLTRVSTPQLFGEDYLETILSNESKAKGLRYCAVTERQWLVIGPAGAGSRFHVDPHSTSAWNALASGLKLWVFYRSAEPPVTPPGVDVMSEEKDVFGHPLLYASPSASEWFWKYLWPKLQNGGGGNSSSSSRSSSSDQKQQQHRPHEQMDSHEGTERLEWAIQRHGDVVFVPHGWWHCVLNLETSVAFTRNFINRQNAAQASRHAQAHAPEHFSAQLREAFVGRHRE